MDAMTKKKTPRRLPFHPFVAPATEVVKTAMHLGPWTCRLVIISLTQPLIIAHYLTYINKVKKYKFSTLQILAPGCCRWSYSRSVPVESADEKFRFGHRGQRRR